MVWIQRSAFSLSSCNHHQGVYLLFIWILWQGKCLVCELSLNVSEADTSVSHHASLNSDDDADMSVYPVRANVPKDCCHFSYLLPSSHNNSTDLITEKYKRLLPTTIILCSRVPEDEAEWVSVSTVVQVWFALNYLYAQYFLLLM